MAAVFRVEVDYHQGGKAEPLTFVGVSDLARFLEVICNEPQLTIHIESREIGADTLFDIAEERLNSQ